MVKAEFIESYIKQGNDYIWNDNHGELIRCKDCKFNEGYCGSEDLHFHLEPLGLDGGALFETRPDFFCAYGKRKEE